MADTSRLPASVSSDPQRLPRLELVYIIVFTLGFFMSIAGVIGASPALAAGGGAGLMLSAGLSWWGFHISMSGTVGNVLRAALGPMPRVSYHARTAAWFAIGLSLAAWGAWHLTRPHADEQELIAPAHLSSR